MGRTSDMVSPHSEIEGRERERERGRKRERERERPREFVKW